MFPQTSKTFKTVDMFPRTQTSFRASRAMWRPWYRCQEKKDRRIEKTGDIGFPSIGIFYWKVEVEILVLWKPYVYCLRKHIHLLKMDRVELTE